MYIRVLNSALLEFGAGSSFAVCSPVYYRMYSSIPALNPLDTQRGICHDNQKCLQTMPDIHWGAISSLVETIYLANVESRSELRDLTGRILPYVSFCLRAFVPTF